jgi:hypothetical protein
MNRSFARIFPFDGLLSGTLKRRRMLMVFHIATT